MRTLGVLIFFGGLCMFLGGMYLIDAYGIARGFIEFLTKMLLIIGMLVGGVIVMAFGNWIGKQKI